MYDQYLSLYIKYIGDYTRQVVLEDGNIGPVGNMGCSRRTKHKPVTTKWEPWTRKISKHCKEYRQDTTLDS